MIPIVTLLHKKFDKLIDIGLGRKVFGWGLIVNTKNSEAIHEEEITLGDLFGHLWNLRAWAFSGGIAAIILAGAALAASHFLGTQVATYSQEISFKLGGQSASHYPNGTAFSPNDLRAPVVVRRVYDDLKIEDLGMSYREFTSAVSVSPSSAIYEGVLGRYRSRLADNSLTFEERRQIEAEFSSALASTLSSGATVNFNAPEALIPKNIGLAVVSAVPNTWADVYINQLGVLNLPVDLSSTDLLTFELLESLDYPAAYDVLETGLRTLGDRTAQIKAVSGTGTLQDAETGQTLFDIEREITRLRRLSLEQVLAPLTELGLSRSPELTAATYQFQLDELERRIKLSRDNALMVERALLNTSAGSMPNVSASGSEEVRVSSTIVQQFGPELVDRLVQMSVENAGVNFRETLIQTKLDFEREAISLSSQKQKIENRLSLLKGSRSGQSDTQLATIFERESQKLVEALNREWRAIGRILDQVNMERVNFDKQLFQPLPTVDQVSVSGSLSMRNLLLALAGAAVFGIIGGLAIGALWRFARRGGRGGYQPA